jgi:hypothetical protein
MSDNELKVITRRLYRKTLLKLRGGIDFYTATSCAIAEEIKTTRDAGVRSRIQQEKGFIMNSFGAILIRRHPGLIV